jgi:predicted Zn-dependent protease
MGHEISHALREHSRERMSEELVKRIGVSVVGAAAKVDTNKLDAVANLVISLPHSREHESEADVMGIELAARAGYDPRAAISVWKKMSALGGKQPLQFMSTHPAHETRIAELEKYMPKVLPLYEETVKQRPKPKGKRRAQPSRVAGLQ